MSDDHSTTRWRRPLLALVSLGALTALAPVAVAAPTPTPSASSSPPARSPSAVATGPTAVDDVGTVGLGSSVTLAGARNDQAGSAALVPARTVLLSDKGSTLSADGRTLQVNGHGSFVASSDGSIAFTPWHGLTGSVSARYRITDAGGATAEGRLSVVVTAGGYRDELETFQDVDASVDPLANDVPGRNADGTPGVLDRASVRFSPPDPYGNATVSADQRTITYPTVGVLTIDASTGVVTLDPDASYVSDCCSIDVRYTGQDTTVAEDGTTQHHSFVAILIFRVDPNRPLVTNSFVTTPFNASVLMAGVTDDKPSNPRLPLRPELAFFDIDPSNIQPGSSLSQDKRTFRWVGYGTWSVNPDGSVVFAPVAGFVGEISLDLTVLDAAGNRANDYLHVVVQPGPAAKPDTVTTAQNVTTAVAVLGNDVAGKNADAKNTRGSMDPTFVRFPPDGQPTGATVSDYSRTLTVPDEGVYTADRVTGAISFDPVPQFAGTARAVTYSARDTVTRTSGQPYGVVHNPVSATLTVSVAAITPVALNNWATTSSGQAVDIAVLDNDRGGAASAPLDRTSVRLRTTSDLPSGSTLGAEAKTLTIPGRGTFVVRADGVVVFSPAPGFTGRVPTIGYSVADANHTRSTPATITVQVGGAR